MLVLCTLFVGVHAHRGTHPFPRYGPRSLAPQLRSGEWLPRGDELDGKIAQIFFPSVANGMVVPLTGVVDTVWVGRMGDALALAAQGAANQLFNAVSYAVSFVPTVTVPLVAAAYARGDLTAARARTCESLWLSCTIGLVGTMILVGAPRTALLLILPADALTMPLAASYLWLRSLSMVPALAASVAFAAFRGCLDVVTPLKVTLVSNLVNLVLDPIFIFSANMGVAGAAIATVVSEVIAAVLYLSLLLRRRLASWALLLRAPRASAILPLLAGSSSVFVRNLAWNSIMLLRARSASAADVTGTSAAAYAICLQIYYLGTVFCGAIQTCGSVLVANALGATSATSNVATASSTSHSFEDASEARRVANRVLTWSGVVGFVVCAVQLAALPILVPLFTPLESVQRAVYGPAAAAALVQLANGPAYAAEGIAMGACQWGALTRVTLVGLGLFLLSLRVSSKLGLGPIAAHVGVWISLGLLNAAVAVGLIAQMRTVFRLPRLC